MTPKDEEADALIQNENELDLSPPSKTWQTFLLPILAAIIFTLALLSNSKKYDDITADLSAESLTGKATGNNAPIGLSDIDTTSSLLQKVMAKYGFNADGEAVERDTSSVSQGWAWAYLYEGSCDGDPVAAGGVATGVCFPVDEDSTSWMFDCDSDGDVYVTSYNGTDCNVTVSTTVAATVGCEILNWTVFSVDDSATTPYIQVSCSRGTALPVHGVYNVWKSYVNPEPTCDSGIACFDAIPLGSCTPFERTYHGEHGEDSYSYDSVIYGESDGEPYMTYYSFSSNCTGEAVDMTLPTNCTIPSIDSPDKPMSSEISYLWEYYSGDSKPTAFPTRASHSKSKSKKEKSARK